MAKEAGKKGATRGRRKQLRNVPAGIAHVRASFNNTIISITDPSGNVVAWATAGRVGYSGSRKSSAFAATMATRNAAKTAQSMGMREIEVNLRGPGSGREAVVRELQSQGFAVTVIRDCTPVPHNGCRPRKRRRV